MKKTLLTLGLCLLLSGCANSVVPIEEQQSFPLPELPVEILGTLDFTLPIYPEESLHPTLVRNETNQVLASLLYEGLFSITPDYEIVPQLVADYWHSDGATQWTFVLKEDIFFWDGTALSGKIVASALNEAKGNESRYQPRFSQISSVTGTDTEVHITLTQGNAQLPYLLDIPISYGGGDLPQGTGPYVYQEEALTLNPLWWGEENLPSEIKLLPLNNQGDLISAFDGGNLSLLDGDLTGTQVLGYSGNYQVWTYPNSNLFYLGFHMENAHVSQGNFRQTLSLALDREQLVSQVLAGYGKATIHPTQVDTSLPEWQYDSIQSALDFSNYGKVSAPLRLIYHGDSLEKSVMAEEIAQQLSVYDINIQLMPLSWTEFLQALTEGNFDLYLSEIYLTPDCDLSSLLQGEGEFNFGGYANEYSDFLWQSYRSGTEVEDMDFFTYFQEDMPIAPLCFGQGTALTLWGHITHATPSLNHMFYGLEDWTFGA